MPKQQALKVPHDQDAENAVIGSVLIDGKSFIEVDSILEETDFFFDKTAMLYKACSSLYKRRESINQITVAQELEREKNLEACGGAAFLSELVAMVPTSLDIGHYGEIVRRLAVSRRIISLAQKIAHTGYAAEPDTNKEIADIVGMVNLFRQNNTAFNELVTPNGAANILMELMEQYSNPQAHFSWGFRDLDDITAGIYPELVIIGSRPGVGKTQLMLDIAENLHTKTILFCTVEMSPKALMERKLARVSQVDIKRLRFHGFSGMDAEMERSVMELAGEVAEQQIFYLPRGSSSQDVYNEAAKLKESMGLDIVFVDYLQLLSDCWRTDKENQNVRVGRACKMLKSLVNDLEIPVVAASQLSRQLEYRAEKRPSLADLRDSGNIEQDADVVFLLYRDEEREDLLEVKMAKNRQLGPARAIRLQWLAERHCYVDYFGDSNADQGGLL